jgi:hypothetical protein
MGKALTLKTLMKFKRLECWLGNVRFHEVIRPYAEVWDIPDDDTGVKILQRETPEEWALDRGATT